jgi:hypothetical protein
MVARLDLAFIIAAIVRHGRRLAVVALFTALAGAVAANGYLHARCPRSHAHPAAVDRAALIGAAVATDRVHVVTLLTTLENTVATDDHFHARLADDRAIVVKVDLLTVAGATIPSGGVAIVAEFTGFELSVAANVGGRTATVSASVISSHRDDEAPVRATCTGCACTRRAAAINAVVSDRNLRIAAAARLHCEPHATNAKQTKLVPAHGSTTLRPTAAALGANLNVRFGLVQAETAQHDMCTASALGFSTKNRLRCSSSRSVVERCNLL